MSKQKLTFHSNLDGKMDGAQVPVFVRMDAEWVKVADGTYDFKNKFINVEVDTDTLEGSLFMESVAKRSLARATLQAHIEIPGPV